MAIRQRLLKYIDSKGISKYKFYQEIGVANGFLDKEGNIGSDKCEKISYQYRDLSLEWLITGNGPMLKNNAVAYKENEESGNAIPLINQAVAAGLGSANFAISKSDVKAYYVIPKFKDRIIDFMIEVAGSSMYPKYNSGDVIACTIIKESKFIQWNKVHVIATKEQGLLVKRIKEDGDNTIIAVSDNPDYPPFKVPKTEITGIALVVGVIRLE